MNHFAVAEAYSIQRIRQKQIVLVRFKCEMLKFYVFHRLIMYFIVIIQIIIAY